MDSCKTQMKIFVRNGPSLAHFTHSQGTIMLSVRLIKNHISGQFKLLKIWSRQFRWNTLYSDTIILNFGKSSLLITKSQPFTNLCSLNSLTQNLPTKTSLVTLCSDKPSNSLRTFTPTPKTSLKKISSSLQASGATSLTSPASIKQQTGFKSSLSIQVIWTCI